MKIRAGRDVSIGRDVIEGEKKSAPWYREHFKTVAWLVVVLALIGTTAAFYFTSGRVEVVFAELIGLALGYLAPKIIAKTKVQ